MEHILDLHIHSKYSRACSKDLTPENIHTWCKKKGITIVGTGDFTHPQWIKELKSSLEEREPGLYALKGTADNVRFMLTTEISCIFSQGGKGRRLHLLILAPNFKAVDGIIEQLKKRGANLKSDGRPIIGLSGKELLQLILDVDPECMMIPAHAWTPWFAVFGSQSGFDSLEECFEELTPHIYAIETGLSSDPPMNWRLSKLDDITLISNSDAHSLSKLGREVNIFKMDSPSYQEVIDIIKAKDKKRFLKTVEFFPEEGKYNYDGHRKCKVCLTPAQTKKLKTICPQCKKKLTVGVLHRVDNLADKKEGVEPKNNIPFAYAVPLEEIIAAVFSKGVKTKTVQTEYEQMVKQATEFDILLKLAQDELNKITTLDIAEAIINVRQGKVERIPGYDGEFGKIIFSSSQEKPEQKALF